MKKFIFNFTLIFMSFFILLATFGCSSELNDEPSVTNYKIGETFKFDDFELTIGSDIKIDIIKNEFSEHDGKDVIKIPITVKNIGKETTSLNMFYYNCYGTQGIQLEDASSFFDDSLDYAGSLRSGASYTRYAYYIYDGDGEYTLEFNNSLLDSDKIEVKFNVKK